MEYNKYIIFIRRFMKKEGGIKYKKEFNRYKI